MDCGWCRIRLVVPWPRAGVRCECPLGSYSCPPHCRWATAKSKIVKGAGANHSYQEHGMRHPSALREVEGFVRFPPFYLHLKMMEQPGEEDSILVSTLIPMAATSIPCHGRVLALPEACPCVPSPVCLGRGPSLPQVRLCGYVWFEVGRAPTPPEACGLLWL